MLKLTKTGIGLLTRQYRSVLKKCWAINVGLFILSTIVSQPAIALVEGTAGQWGLALGEESSATKGSVTVGTYSHAFDDASVAIGHRTNANSDLSVAVGSYAVATGSGSLALGANSIATEDDVVSFGHLRGDVSSKGEISPSDYFRRIINVAAGVNDHDVVIVSQLNSALANKQNALSSTQLAAANSGITATKVSTYDGYSTTIAGKADMATTLAGYGITDAYTKTQVDNLISQAGGSSVDLSNYYTKSETYSINEINNIQSLNNYYRKNKKSEILNGFEEGKIGNENDDNFSKLVANDNFAIVTTSKVA